MSRKQEIEAHSIQNRKYSFSDDIIQYVAKITQILVCCVLQKLCFEFGEILFSNWVKNFKCQ